MTENLIPNEPELKDLLDLFRKNLLLGFNCHHIGTVQSFDQAKQTASATINYKKTFLKPNAAGVYQPTLEDYPTLLDCPVFILGGGKASLRFPIKKGDECMVFFNDRDFDAWFQGNVGAAVPTARLHSFSDGIILVGVRSLANVLQNYNATAAELVNGGNKISVGADGDDIVVKCGTVTTVTFKDNGQVVIANSIGNFTFEANADVSFDTGTVQGLFGNGGHVKFKNVAGNEYTATLIALMQDIALAQTTTPGNPILVPPTFATDLAKLTTFLEP